MQGHSSRAALGLLLVLAAQSFAPAASAQGSSPAPAASPAAATRQTGTMTAPSLGSGTGQAAGGAQLPAPPPPAVLPEVPPIAPAYVAPPVNPPSGDLVGITQQPFVGITLDSAVALALAKDPDLAVAQTNQRIAGYQIVAAQGAYDIRFHVQPSYSSTSQAPLSPFQAGPNGTAVITNSFGANAGLSGLLPNGTEYSVTASGNDITSNNTANGLNSYYPTSLGFTLTQPLGRNTTSADARRQIALALVNQSTNAQNALESASTAVVNVADAYWQLVYAWRNVGIQEEGLREATAQAQSNRRLAAQGQVANADIVEANTQVNVFQSNVFSALQTVQQLQTTLKQLIIANPADPLWQANLVPTTNVVQLPPEPSLNDLIVQALRTRPEIVAVRDERRSADINLAYFKDQKKPQIDLNLGYSTNGLAGYPNGNLSQNPFVGLLLPQVTAINQLIAIANRGLPPGQQLAPVGFGLPAGPSYLNGGLGTSANNTLSNKFPTYSAALTIGFPIRNRTAIANYKIALEQERQLDVTEVQVIQRIKAEAINAIQAYRLARYRLTSASAARAASEQVYQSERRRFAAGESTTFLVLQRELELANNRGLELQSQTDLNRAVVELERVSGSIFAQNNIDVSRLGTSTLQNLGPNPLATAAPANGTVNSAAFGTNPPNPGSTPGPIGATPAPGTSATPVLQSTPAPGVLPPGTPTVRPPG